jgi:hypothetical protein
LGNVGKLFYAFYSRTGFKNEINRVCIDNSQWAYILAVKMTGFDNLVT